MTREFKKQSSSILLLVVFLIGAILSDCGDRASSSPNPKPSQVPKKLATVEELPVVFPAEEHYVFFYKDGKDCYRPLSNYEIQRRKEDREKENATREARAKEEAEKEAMLAHVDEITVAEMICLVTEDKNWDVEITIKVDDENIQEVLMQLENEGLALNRITENRYVCTDDRSDGNWKRRLHMASLVSVERRPVALSAFRYLR